VACTIVHAAAPPALTGTAARTRALRLEPQLHGRFAERLVESADLRQQRTRRLRHRDPRRGHAPRLHVRHDRRARAVGPQGVHEHVRPVEREQARHGQVDEKEDAEKRE